MFLTVQIVHAVAWLALLAGCILLHVRLRNIPSTSFVNSIIALAIWAFWGKSALGNALTTRAPEVAIGQGNNAAEVIATMGHAQSLVAVGDAVLILWVGLSFLFAIKSIKSQRAA